jgi:histidyl-tRNA synthetase
LGGEDDAERRLTVLRAMDKFDKFGTEGVRLLLGEGRKDESGDYTDGAKLSATAIDAIVEILEASAIDDLIDYTNDLTFKTAALSKFAINESFEAGFRELKLISDLVTSAEYQSDRISVDPSVVRGLEYYTGPSMRPNSCSTSPTKKVKSSSSAPSAEVAAMTGWSSALLAATFRRPAFPSAFPA